MVCLPRYLQFVLLFHHSQHFQTPPLLRVPLAEELLLSSSARHKFFLFLHLRKVFLLLEGYFCRIDSFFSQCIKNVVPLPCSLHSFQ